MDQRKKVIQRVTLVGVLVNILLSLTQIISGVFAHSQALIADGLHTLADLFSDFVVMLTAHQSAKEADQDHPYGHGRIETLSSIFLGLILIGVAIGIGIRGVTTLVEGTPTQTESYALAFALLAIFSKEFLYRYTVQAARNIRSTLLESNALHHRSDVFSSIVVVIGIATQIAGIPYMDVVAALIVSVMISLMAIHLIRKAFSELIDTSLEQSLVDSVRQHILSLDGVVAVHSLRSRTMGGMGYIDTEIRVNPYLSVSEAHYISLYIETSVKKNFSAIMDITVHIDPVAETQHDKILQLPTRAQLLFSLYSVWESIDNSDHIQNIRLHYLTEVIDVDIILPLTLGCDGKLQLEQDLIENTSNLHYIGKISIFYAH